MKLKPGTQFAALPFRLRDGEPEVLLITSRGTGRWIIPKGWPIKSLPPSAVAAREAYEEAGLVGMVGKRPVGSYRYEKRVDGSDIIICKVRVFLFEVHEELDEWPEQDDRQRCWLSPTDAAERVSVAKLGLMLLDLPQWLGATADRPLAAAL